MLHYKQDWLNYSIRTCLELDVIEIIIITINNIYIYIYIYIYIARHMQCNKLCMPKQNVEYFTLQVKTVHC